MAKLNDWEDLAEYIEENFECDCSADEMVSDEFDVVITAAQTPNLRLYGYIDDDEREHIGVCLFSKEFMNGKYLPESDVRKYGLSAESDDSEFEEAAESVVVDFMDDSTNYDYEHLSGDAVLPITSAKFEKLVNLGDQAFQDQLNKVIRDVCDDMRDFVRQQASESRHMRSVLHRRSERNFRNYRRW